MIDKITTLTLVNRFISKRKCGLKLVVKYPNIIITIDSCSPQEMVERRRGT